jgi:ribulose-5-phosphate 4-epimerase/fuculose-1-phosphate aldolase
MNSLRPMYRSAGIVPRFVCGARAALVAVLLGTAPLQAQPPTSAGVVDPALVEDLVAANRILVAQGIVDAYGHVSVRHPRDPNRFLLSRSLAPGLVTADDLIEYDLSGVAVDLRGRAEYSERYIHAEIYQARPDVNSVVHNHSPSVIPFGISTVPIRPVYHMAGFIGAGLPVFDIRERFGMTDMLVNDADRGRELARELAGHTAVLMRGHGVSVVGPTISFAVARSVYLELNARIQLEAIGLGGEVTYLDPAEAQHVLDAGENRGYTRPWEIWKREALGTP